ncbi:MAG: TraR/DksA family transcriptional regulator [Sphaerochaetaceae bacterium]|jgi:DnaK suppressor protein|nr:TraR/DksA family transcriptional regulator [Sphaerochaetaceae bacterium]
MERELTPFEKEMEQILLSKRADILDKLAKSNEDFREIAEQMGAKDSIDMSVESLAFKKMEAINQHDASVLRSIDYAIIRVHEGRYGVCLKCGCKIPEKRLRAIPYAVLCVDCKSKEEAGNR